MRRVGILAGVALFVTLWAAPAAAQFTGQILTSDAALPDPSGSTAEWNKSLKKAHKTTFVKDENGNWTVFFLAFMKKAAGTNELNVVFYDITKGKPDQVHYISFNVTPAQKTLKSQFKLTTDDPVKAGNKYEVRLTRVVNNKEDVLAKVVLTFK